MSKESEKIKENIQSPPHMVPSEAVLNLYQLYIGDTKKNKIVNPVEQSGIHQDRKSKRGKNK